MKTVILLRHAKSSWDDPALEDHDRPLNPRGKRAAPVIGQWLCAKGHLPDTVLCSTATRAVDTLKRMELAPRASADVQYLPELYHASPETMLEVLRTLEDAHQTVMLIGHEPGMGAMARVLSDQVSPRCKRAFEHFPTGAAAVLEFKVDDWKSVGYGLAKFVDFAKPRELMDA